MKKSHLLSFGAFSLLTLSCLGNVSCAKKAVIYEDNALYDQEIASYDMELAPKKSYEEEQIRVDTLEISFESSYVDLSNRVFFIWTVGTDGVEIETTYNGTSISTTINIADSIYQGSKGLYFIVKQAGTWAGQSEDCYIDYSLFNVDEFYAIHVYAVGLQNGGISLFSSEAAAKNMIEEAYFTDWKTIHVVANGNVKGYELYAFDKYFLSLPPEAQVANKASRIIASGTPNKGSDNKYTFDIVSDYNIPTNVQFVVETIVDDLPHMRAIVSAEKLYETAMFKTLYEYDGNDLGATYSKESTTFKIWAPTAAFALVDIYKENYYLTYKMSFMRGGVWAATIQGDLEGLDYTYTLYNSNGIVTTNDPYAKACTHNGERSTVVDFSDTNPAGWEDIPNKWDGNALYDITTPQELSIYETHIRDLTMHESWQGNNQRGTFLAAAETNTTFTAYGKTVKTGFDHIEELGVNAVQLMPVFDFAGDESDSERYDWGYAPINYNCVEGSYSSDPSDAKARIREYKQLILNLARNNNHTRTIMDVVYNHVASVRTSCLEKTMPGYYFRKSATGELYDASGCGNEVKSEAPMMSKYIVDSLCFWATEYKIKGFRFDLMGVIDHITMKKAAQELYKIDPDIYLYGEGYTALGVANIDNGSSSPYYGYYGADSTVTYEKLKKDGDMCYIGCFNIAGRDYLRGSNNDYPSFYPGYGFLSLGNEYVGNDSIAVGSLLLGANSNVIVSQSPKQTINYASCHDNYTLFDQFSYTHRINNSWSNDLLEGALRAVTISNMVVMMSNGVAFMSGGEELYRSKVATSEEDINKGNEYTMVEINGNKISSNSYNLSDAVNAYDYSRKIAVTYNGYTVNVESQYASLKTAISVRKDLQFKDSVLNNDTSNYWDVGEGCTKLAWYILSKNKPNGLVGYKLLVSGRYGYPNSVYSSDTTIFAKVGQVVTGTTISNPGDATSLGMYACAIVGHY